MKVSFFEPSHKVHKQRDVMKNTDQRLMQYSRFNVLINVVVFAFIVAISGIYIIHPLMTVVLSVGLIVTALVRCYILFRFEVVYPQGPERWRNLYFFSTLMGAVWWGLLLASLTFTLEVSTEVSLLWLYTIGVFSSCAHVFSPYQRFYSLYMLVSIVPSLAVAFVSSNLLTTIYGAVLGLILLLLQKQGHRLGDDYWDRLQLSYELSVRTNALEVEKMTSQSSSVNKDTLVNNINQELKASLREIIGSLKLIKTSKLSDQDARLISLVENKSQQQMNMLKNVLELSNITGKNILLNQEVIDFRGCCEKEIVDVSGDVYQKKIEIFTRFSPTFPLRVRADAGKIKQMLGNLIRVATGYTDEGSLLIAINNKREMESNLTEFSFEIFVDQPLRNPDVEQELYDSFQPHYAKDILKGLNLAITKGLADSMQGDTGALYTKEGQLKFWFTVHLEVVTPKADAISNLKMSGKRVLLFQPPAIIKQEYVLAFEAWGIRVDIAESHTEAFTLIREKQSELKYYDVALICTQVNDISALSTCRQLAEVSNTLEQKIPQIVCLTAEQAKLPLVGSLLTEFPNVSILQKPIAYKKLKSRFKDLLCADEHAAELEASNFLKDKHVLLFQYEDINITIAKVLIEQLGCTVITAKNIDDTLSQLKTDKFDALLTETHIKNIEITEFISQAKESNQALHENGYILPILGLNSHETQTEAEEAQCLQSGINYYVDMPLQLEDLGAILRRWIGRAETMAEDKKSTH